MKKSDILGVIILGIAVLFYYGCDFIESETTITTPEDNSGTTMPPTVDPQQPEEEKPPVDPEQPEDEKPPVVPEEPEGENPPLASNARILNTGNVITAHGSIDVSTLAHRTDSDAAPIVYMTKEISSEALLAMYKVLGVDLSGDSTVVKLHAGEGVNSNNLDPELIEPLVTEVKGTIADSLTIYPGPRRRVQLAKYKQIMSDRGYAAIAPWDIMDEHGEISIPVMGGDFLTENLVGESFDSYDSYIVLSHFKGHSTGGFGGALKNMAIGFASEDGKSLIHSAGQAKGKTFAEAKAMVNIYGGDFQRSMAEAAKSIHEYVASENKEIIYISVMNLITLYCDCYTNPGDPLMDDIGIFASLDPVALDQACVDFIYEAHDSNTALVNQMATLGGFAVFEQAEKKGFGSREYQLATIDN